MQLTRSRFAILLLPLIASALASDCNEKQFKSGKVCVCDLNSCDEVPELGLTMGQAAVFTTSHSGHRLHREIVYATDNDPIGTLHMTLDSTKKYQQIQGFGSTFSDAAGANLKSLPDKLADTIIRQYFSPQGLNYKFGRVPIGASDFSAREYSYDLVDGDFQMQKFNLTVEDTQWKIPYIKKAVYYSGSSLNLLAVPWSAPGWLKTTHQVAGPGAVQGKAGDEYHKAYAKYFVKFFEDYAKANVNFWGVSVQNEPTEGSNKKEKAPETLFTAETQRDFIKTDFGPALKDNEATKNLKVLILDDERKNLPKWADTILKDKDAAKYVSGIGVHYYEESEKDEHLDKTHKNHPDVFILGTEASDGAKSKETTVEFGSWDRAEDYASNIIDDLNNWLVGWIDRNLVLDAQGGPSFFNVFADAPIIAFPNVSQFYKQPMFYAIAHFSRFIQPGAYRIDHSFNVIELEVRSAVFQNPDGSKVVILLNKSKLTDHTVIVKDSADARDHYHFKLPTRSIATLYINSINF
ncbi:unnamed protein product [Caenorhabditis bovis]|uniref:Glucosylceramidase n=1 Tax=Caenorhabditis bovis TaxID=2654633 RepID=A0A8S1EVW8_9PELO|nr:unnamed protein product [Caenorhabditis bovis]